MLIVPSGPRCSGCILLIEMYTFTGLILVINNLHNVYGAPGRIRTCDPRLRRPMFYPTELLAPAVCAEQSITGTGRGRQWWR